MSQTASHTSTARTDGLKRRHETLEARLAELRSHPSADEMEIKSLKREKLRLKEEMNGLRH